MSRLFDDASLELLEVDQVVVTAAPLTISGWMRLNDPDENQIIVNIQDTEGEHYWRLIAMGAVTGDRIHIRVKAGGPPVIRAITTTGYSLNVWHHVCAVEAASNDHRVYIDGGSKGTETTNRSPSDVARTTVGGRQVAGHASGNVGHIAIWNVALTDQEVASLAAGVSPLRMRRESLVGYWPINGQSPELEVMGSGADLALFNNPVPDEEPPIPYNIVAP